MNNSYWQKQSDEPLYPRIEWNKPERRDQAGRVLIIGGYLHNLQAPAKSYELLKKHGVGEVKVALPSKLKKLFTTHSSSFQGLALETLFLPSTKSGEFARDGFEELVDCANWADTVLLPGDIGRNSQTTILLADLLDSSDQQFIITRDAVDTLSNTPEMILNRPRTTLVISFSQLQQIAKRVNWPDPFTFTMGLVKLVENLHDLSQKYPVAIVVNHQDTLVCAVSGEITTTKLSRHPEFVSESNDSKQILKQVPNDNLKKEENLRWRLDTAALAACYQTWNPNTPLEALTHGAYLFSDMCKA